jgi:two-component system LytT family response regulator
MTRGAPLRVVIVDDEAPARRKLVRLLREEGGVEVVAEADGGPVVIAAIEQHRPDLVFLDIRMPGLDGFGVIGALSASPAPRVVFVTAYEQYAVRAFEVHAFDYLLKPVGRDRFREVLRRAREERAEASGDITSRLGDLLDELRRERGLSDRLLVQEGGRAVFVPTREIAWVEADRNYLVLHHGAKTYTLRGTLDALERTFDPKLFVRINRSSLVPSASSCRGSTASTR